MEDFTPLSALRETLENAMQRMRRGREPFEANVELQLEILKELRTLRKEVTNEHANEAEEEGEEGDS